MWKSDKQQPESTEALDGREMVTPRINGNDGERANGYAEYLPNSGAQQRRQFYR